MKPVEPIITTHLFPHLHAQLIPLLKSLTPDDWLKPTACTPWTVKDVVAHLLDGQIKRLSLHRDRLPLLKPETPITTNTDLVTFINRTNEEWIRVARRIGPNLLIEFLDVTGPQVYQFFEAIDPHGPAVVSVSWAGEEASANWFDIAREYTEWWLHQQHIRDAIDQPGLTDRTTMYPVLDTFMRALPFTYRAIEASDGTSIVFTITGEAGGAWSLVREMEAWQLFYGQFPQPATRVTLSQDTAWRLFTKGLDPAAASLQLEGDKALATTVLQMVSIVA